MIVLISSPLRLGMGDVLGELSVNSDGYGGPVHILTDEVHIEIGQDNAGAAQVQIGDHIGNLTERVHIDSSVDTFVSSALPVKILHSQSSGNGYKAEPPGPNLIATARVIAHLPVPQAPFGLEGVRTLFQKVDSMEGDVIVFAGGSSKRLSMGRFFVRLAVYIESEGGPRTPRSVIPVNIRHTQDDAIFR